MLQVWYLDQSLHAATFNEFIFFLSTHLILQYLRGIISAVVLVKMLALDIQAHTQTGIHSWEVKEEKNAPLPRISQEPKKNYQSLRNFSSVIVILVCMYRIV